MHVADVRAGRSPHEQVPERLEEMIRVIPRQRRLPVEAQLIGARHGTRIHHRARGIGWTIDAIGAGAAEHCGSPERRHRGRGGERELLVASA